MKQNENYFEPAYTTSLQRHAARTFGWMTIGLLVTTVVAMLVTFTGTFDFIFSIPMLPIVMIVAQLGLVFALAGRIMKMSPTSAKILFLLYSALTGITFSVLGLVYSVGTLALAFLVTTVYFGSLAVIGLTTKMNLLKLGPILIGALFALIITQIVMMFLNVSTDTMLFSAIGLLIFTGITAYDAQKMKALYMQYEQDELALQRLSIYSAFDLYLDFINIFLYILRFLGNRD